MIRYNTSFSWLTISVDNLKKVIRSAPKWAHLRTAHMRPQEGARRLVAFGHKFHPRKKLAGVVLRKALNRP
jgi:hypothetical protein